MKIAHCVACGDFVAPYRDWETNQQWRWCACEQTATRWRDGALGLLLVTSLHGPAGVRVLGLNNGFLHQAVAGVESFAYGDEDTDAQWRILHDLVAENTPPNYLFSEPRRQCWAILMAVGETGDVTFVDYCQTPHLHERCVRRTRSGVS